MHDHRYIHPMNIAFLDGRLERDFVAFIPDDKEVISQGVGSKCESFILNYKQLGTDLVRNEGISLKTDRLRK